MTRLPALFVSHGSPMIALSDIPARRFFEGLSARLPRPKEILAVSAHWECAEPTVSLAPRPETIHDFYGFPKPLYELSYPAPGAPDLARRTAQLIGGAGMPVSFDPKRGLDHGAWIPLLLAYPEADIPVTQLSVQTNLGPAHHRALGRALAPLRDQGVLILASGNLTHDLSSYRGQPDDAPAPGWVSSFAEWVQDKLEAGDAEALVNYREQAPNARRNHPSEEHFLPLHAALGAGEADGRALEAEVLHRSYNHSVLAMDAYAFN
jgi:4,5-DOPA dioxygenase extradiol